MKFGDNLKKLRNLKKLSQEELAMKVNVSRQSVSKWETGEAYPSMNNLLELCRIFHCRMNDLVNDGMLDVDSLDDEVKKNVVMLKKEQQNRMRAISKAIMIISKISRVLLMVCIPLIVALMTILGVLIHQVEVSDNEISFTYAKDKVISARESDGRVVIDFDGKRIEGFVHQEDVQRMREMFENNGKYVTCFYVEVGFIILIIDLVLVIFSLQSLEKLFFNLSSGDTPFTLENVGYIKKIACFMIVVTILPVIVGLIFEHILMMDLDVGFELFNLMEILFLFSISYVFQYGYELQLDSNGKMYGDIHE